MCSLLGLGLGLPDHLKFFQGHFIFQEIRLTTFMVVRRGRKMGFCPLQIGTKNQKMLENLKSASQFRLIDFCNGTLFTDMQGRNERGQVGHNPLGAETLWGRQMTARGTKNPNNVTSTFFNKLICFRKISGSNMGGQTCFLPWGTSNLVTLLPVWHSHCTKVSFTVLV